MPHNSKNGHTEEGKGTRFTNHALWGGARQRAPARTPYVCIFGRGKERIFTNHTLWGSARQGVAASRPYMGIGGRDKWEV